MKSKILIVTTIVLFFASCGAPEKKVSKDLKDMTLDQLKKKQDEIKQNLADVESLIKEKDTTEAKKPLVTTFNIKKEEFNHYLELQGSVSTKQNIVVTPEYNGILTAVYVKEGQRVGKGQVLARVDDGGLSQQLAQLEIQLALAKTTYERQERLYKQNIGSEIQYLQAKSQYEAQEKAVAQTRTQISKTAIRAPFSGVIDDVISEQGTVVAAGQSAVFRLVNLNNMYIETSVPEKYLTSIKVNKQVKVNFPILGREIDSKVRQVGNYINPDNRTFKIEVGVSNKDNKARDIKPNLTAKLKINDYTNKEAVMIPLDIISEDGEGMQYVYVVDSVENSEGIVKRQFITTGLTKGSDIEVIEGLTEGMQVVQEGARVINDNQEVKIKNYKAESDEPKTEESKEEK